MHDVADLDPVAVWGETQERVCVLALGLDADAAARTVPATPDWTVRDLLAHMVGVGADVLADEEDPDHAPWWTQKHVTERAGRDIGQLVGEWRDLAPGLMGHMREHGARPLADVTIHEHDLRGAVGRPGAQHDPGLAWVTERMLERVRPALAAGPSLALVSPTATWTSHDGPVESADVELHAEDFDIARALTTRRTERQLRRWTVRGDLDDVLAAFTLLGPLPARELPC
ncbi:hypothetical protein KLP28_16690 [Nocardioidaceae bacterium]|nr:hypothetical protein KLP28_16690 [Nocardioidaceae bacterium]